MTLVFCLTAVTSLFMFAVEEEYSLYFFSIICPVITAVLLSMSLWFQKLMSFLLRNLENDSMPQGQQSSSLSRFFLLAQVVWELPSAHEVPPCLSFRPPCECLFLHRNLLFRGLPLALGTEKKISWITPLHAYIALSSVIYLNHATCPVDS